MTLKHYLVSKTPPDYRNMPAIKRAEFALPLKIFVCEICGEELGVFHPDEIYTPIKGFQFKSLDTLTPSHPRGYPAPFPLDLDWEDLQCLVCRKRPFLERNSILTVPDKKFRVKPKPVKKKKNKNLGKHADIFLEC